MDQYRILLALSYFKEKKGQYSISELMLILGFNNKQISELIEFLLNNCFLEYNDDFLLVITDKGIEGIDAFAFKQRHHLLPVPFSRFQQQNKQVFHRRDIRTVHVSVDQG